MSKQKIPFRNHQFETSLFNQRVIVAFLFMLIALGGLVFNLYHLQVRNHDRYQVRSNRNRIKIIPVAPNRGLIYDRNGVVLAQNIPVSTLELTPAKIDDINATLASLQKLLNLSDHDIAKFKKLMHRTRSTKPITLIEQMSEVQIAKFSVNQFHYNGTNINAYLERYYPYGESLTHVLGYVGKINDRDIRTLKKDNRYTNYEGTHAIGKLWY